MKKKVRLAVLITALILCYLVPMIGVTYGLFQETIKTENHIVSGSLKATLVRQKLTSYNIDENGIMKSVVDDEEKDFTNSTNDTIFGVDGSKLIVPGSSFTAEMKISNKGDVAFYYYVEIYFNAAISDSAFASMLKLSVVSQNDVRKETTIKDALSLGEDTGIGLVVVGASEVFTVKMEYMDTEDNDKAENKFVMFDLRVHAVQKLDTD